MRPAALADVLKVILYVIACYFLAALITPTFFEVGRAFSIVALAKDPTDQVTWLAQNAQHADLPSYFRRALYLSALILAFPLFFVLNLRRNPRPRLDLPWSLKLPTHSTRPQFGQPLRKNLHPLRHFVLGFVLTLLSFGLMTAFLRHLNWLSWSPQTSLTSVTLLFIPLLPSILFTVILTEFIFRGALFGIFLRAFPPTVALILVSLLAAVIELMKPTSGLSISTNRSSPAGFEILHALVQNLFTPETLQSFLPLFSFALILGLTRYLTASLWLPLGIHAATLIAIQLFQITTIKNPHFPLSLQPYLGTSPLQGLVPLATIILFSLAILALVKPRPERPLTFLPE